MGLIGGSQIMEGQFENNLPSGVPFFFAVFFFKTAKKKGTPDRRLVWKLERFWSKSFPSRERCSGVWPAEGCCCSKLLYGRFSWTLTQEISESSCWMAVWFVYQTPIWHSPKVWKTRHLAYQTLFRVQRENILTKVRGETSSWEVVLKFCTDNYRIHN